MKRKSLLWTPLLAMLLLSVATVNLLYSDSTAISVQPSAIIDDTLGAGDTFSINLIISDVTNLGGFNFNLTYDTAVLTATKITLLNGTDDWFSESHFWYREINDFKGTAIAVASRTEEGVDGTGAVITIDFKVDAVGETWLNLTDTELASWEVPAQKMEHDIYNGYFDNRPAAGPAISVEPPAIVDEALVPGESFSVDIVISDVENLGGYEFKLNYSTSVLTTSSADVTVVTDWFGPSVKVWTKKVDDALGYVRLVVTLPLGTIVGIDGSGTVVTIRFTVDDIGTTVLDLNNTELGDPFATPIIHNINDGCFSNLPILLPIASFTYSPETPKVDEAVSFDASASYDPDGSIVSYSWHFGDGTTSTTTDPIITHAYTAVGTYTVALTITDNYGLTDTATKSVNVVGVHDIAITSVSAYPTTVRVGETVTISVTVKNEGTETETFKVTVYYDDFTISTFGETNLPPGSTRTWTTSWFTYAVPPGAYKIKAVAETVPDEIDIDDNTYFDGIVTIIPRPIPKISINPDSGPTGTKITVNGSDFPPTTGLYLMFDDHLLCFLLTELNGNFTATFSVPLTEAGEHAVKAWTIYYYPYQFYSAEATFTVIDTTPLDVNADVGAIYFKGETAEFYVQTSFKGVPVDATSIHVTLYKPDGTAETLTAQRTATGLYKIEYSIEGKESMLGTYTLVVEVNHSSTTVDATGTSLKTFLVKSPWREWKHKAPKIALSIVTLAAASALIIIWRRENQK